MTSPAGLARNAVRWMLTTTAKDVTSDSATRSCLVVAPHPDDETLGCGARILSATGAGAKVVVVVATDGRHSHASDRLSADELVRLRRVELAEATTRLGVKPDDVIELGYEDGTLAARFDELVERLVTLIRDLRPDDVYATAVGEHHPDHDAVGRAVALAVERSGVRCRRYEYAVWLWASWPFSRRVPIGRGLRQAIGLLVGRRVHAVSTNGVRPRKRHALEAYRSQLTNLTGEPGWGVLPAEVLRRAEDRREIFFLREHQP